MDPYIAERVIAQLAAIANQLEQINHFLRKQMEEQAAIVRQRADGQPANVAYLSSKWPRRDGDKFTQSTGPTKPGA
jgi:hypothetical protein